MPQIDGRDARWAAHRRSRRRELVEAALRAVREHGAGVGMDEIAAAASTSKTVVYRHLGDRAGLHAAVVAAVDEQILGDLHAAMDARAGAGRTGDARLLALTEDPQGLVAALVDCYLRLVERDPEVYRFVVTRPARSEPREAPEPPTDDPLTGLTHRIADELAAIFAARLRAQGRDPAPAGTWAHGMVGLVRAATDAWLDGPDRLSRAEVVAHVSALAGAGLAAALAARKDGTR
ncbi:MAG TPA: TetR family transcriptional regulator [Segeticoccus sp.]|uniref:TetR/AcrR family transcriptional regulator n=1 Tax=Segeticoccus sp. TaxID=2706531 RepID=UPI002D80C8FB|nr:TetR family transcriptional regulator [Segeticoccus sp.]HET8599753.1 TetR family transcriptional regulator [Segeticoccus sp.]